MLKSWFINFCCKIFCRWVLGGIGARCAKGKVPSGTRILVLDKFPLVSFGVIWRGDLSVLREPFLAEAATTVHLLQG